MDVKRDFKIIIFKSVYNLFIFISFLWDCVLSNVLWMYLYILHRKKLDWVK